MGEQIRKFEQLVAWQKVRGADLEHLSAHGYWAVLQGPRVKRADPAGSSVDNV